MCLRPLFAGTELNQVPCVAWAVDREASIRSGLAIDQWGDAIVVCRPWLDICVVPDVASSTFKRQVSELAGALCQALSHWRPVLPTHFSDRPIWETDLEALMERVKLHIENCEHRPPSFTSDTRDMKKDTWRCASWEDVKARAACINIVADMGEAQPASSSQAGGAQRRGASRSGKEDPTVCTVPRTLELYCGRAGFSSHQKQVGNNAFFLDLDREYVSSSFAAVPKYDEGGQVKPRPPLALSSPCLAFSAQDLVRISPQVWVLNGLDEEHFIHLDFLDFAMSVIKGDINVGDLHAIHDGFDCKTFTDMSSKAVRQISNAFFGVSPEAFATNLRCALAQPHLSRRHCRQSRRELHRSAHIPCGCPPPVFLV